MSAQAPVGTTLAILERTLKMMSAVQARVHYAMKREFQLLKAIIRDYTPDEYNYEPEEGGRKAKKSDYDLVEVIPVSDPNAATMAQKIVQYQAVIQLAQTAPQIYDLPYLHRQMLEVLGIKNAQKLVPLKDDDSMKPRDPVSENMDLLNGKPVKAFLYQDHQAHITVHMAAYTRPADGTARWPVAERTGYNEPQPQPTFRNTLRSSIASRLKSRLASRCPRQTSEMDEDTEIAVSRLAAQAATQLFQKNQAQAAQQQAQQMAQDPLVQMQQAELQLKSQGTRTQGEEVHGRGGREERPHRGRERAHRRAEGNRWPTGRRKSCHRQGQLVGKTAGSRASYGYRDCPRNRADGTTTRTRFRKHST